MICPLMSGKAVKKITEAKSGEVEYEPIPVECLQWDCGFWNGAVGTCGIPAISNDLQNINNALDNLVARTGG